MKKWSRGGKGDGPKGGRAGWDGKGDKERKRRLSGKPSTGTWYAKTMVSALPSLIAGSAGLISTTSAAALAVAGTAVTTLISPAVDSWFKGREIKAQEDALAAATSGEFGDLGAIAKALAAIAGVYEVLTEVTGPVDAGQRSLEEARAELAAILGGGQAVPQQLRETLSLNGEAQADLQQVSARLAQATAALRRFQASLS